MRNHRFFTLTELITAMAVLIVLMLALVNFFTAAQNAWSDSAKRGEIYENANVIFDIVSRDIQSIAYNPDRPTFHFYDIRNTPANRMDTPSNAASNFANPKDYDPDIAFVAASPITPKNTFCSPYFEIQYDVKSGYFRRSCTYDDGSQKVAWNYFSEPRWYRDVSGVRHDSEDFVELVFGVVDFKVTPYTSSMSKYSSSSQYDVFPYALKCDLTLMDNNAYAQYCVLPSAQQSDFINRYARKFSQIYYLGDRQ